MKDRVESDIVRRFARGHALLDAGIGTGRVSLPLLGDGVRLTGVDASAAMIERCAADARAAGVRLIPADFTALPFAGGSFDTVLSADAFAYSSDWATTLDEFVRVTRPGGRIIVDLGSADHVAAVAQARGCSEQSVLALDPAADPALLRLAHSEVAAYARERGASLIALVPYGAALGSLVPNLWTGVAYVARSGALDRLVSWIGVDPRLFAFAEFIERRVAQQLAPAVCDRMYAVFELRPDAAAYCEPSVADIASRDERGAAVWESELHAHLASETNRAFAVALLAAALPTRIAAAARDVLPAALRHDLERHELAVELDAVCAADVETWCANARELHFHGVNLARAIAPTLLREWRERRADLR